jgi:hypothetical protein
MKPATIMFGLLIGLTHVVPAAACHRFSQWFYPTPQRCGTTTPRMARLVYARPPSPPDLHPVLAPAPVSVERRVSIPLPSLNDITWGGAMDTELELSLQRQKALRQLSLPAE